MICPWPIVKCVLHSTIIHGILPHALSVVDQRFAIQFVHRLAFFLALCLFSSTSIFVCTFPVVSRFAHPLGFAFPFSVLPSALPII